MHTLCEGVMYLQSVNLWQVGHCVSLCCSVLPCAAVCCSVMHSKERYASRMCVCIACVSGVGMCAR